MKELTLYFVISILSTVSCADQSLEDDLKIAAKSKEKILYYEYSTDQNGYSVSRGSLVLMDIENDKKIYLIKDTSTDLNPIFSKDGNMIFLTYSGKLEIWDLNSADVRSYKLSENNISAFSLFDEQTIIYSDVNKLYKYSIQDKQKDFIYESKSGIVKICLNPSSEFLATEEIKISSNDLTPNIRLYSKSGFELMDQIQAASLIGWINSYEVLIQKYLNETDGVYYQTYNIVIGTFRTIGNRLNDSLFVTNTKILDDRIFMEVCIEKAHTIQSETYYYPENVGLIEYYPDNNKHRLIFSITETEEICDFYIKK